MKWFKKVMTVAVLISAILVFSGVSYAVPYADFSYVETNLNNGTWRYNYTLYNMANPVADAGFNLFDAMIIFNSTAAYNSISAPTGWDKVSGAGFTEITSTIPGLPADGGFDLAPGASLTGLSFTLDYRAGQVVFDAYFTNPNDPDEFSLYYTGTTSAESVPVPEPSTLLLLGLGLGGFVFYRRKSKQCCP